MRGRHDPQVTMLALVGLIRLNCELFGGRFPYRVATPH